MLRHCSLRQAQGIAGQAVQVARQPSVSPDLNSFRLKWESWKRWDLGGGFVEQLEYREITNCKEYVKFIKSVIFIERGDTYEF